MDPTRRWYDEGIRHLPRVDPTTGRRTRMVLVPFKVLAIVSNHIDSGLSGAASTTSAAKATQLPDNCSISIITMVYRSAAFLSPFTRQIRDALHEAGLEDHEIIFVNDGSPDSSLEHLLDMRRQDERIKIVDLARNFGHHKAAIAGLAHSRGELVFMIDCDLEVSPETFPRFLDALRDNDADVVYGVQKKRKGGLVEKLGGSVFWKLFNLLSDTKVPESVLTERLMTRSYVDALLSLGDRNIFLAGMMHWPGFRQVGITVEKRVRDGDSTYSMRKRLSLLIEAITSFSTVPLKLMLALGLALTGCASIFALGLLARKLLHPSSVLLGFTTLAVLIIGIGGVIITLMGVLGLYVSRIFVQTQARPIFIVRNFHG